MAVNVARILAVLAVVAIAAFGFQTYRLRNIEARLARESLPEGVGWTTAAPSHPMIPDVPRRAAVATVEGRVRYLPIKETRPNLSSVPCDLKEIDADIHCRVEVVTGGARLKVWGALRGFGQERLLPSRWAGDLPDPSPTGNPSPIETAPPIVHVNAPLRPLLWEARAGYVVPTKAVRIGATRMLTRRFGVYVDATVPLETADGFDAGAGVAVRF